MQKKKGYSAVNVIRFNQANMPVFKLNLFRMKLEFQCRD